MQDDGESSAMTGSEEVSVLRVRGAELVNDVAAGAPRLDRPGESTVPDLSRGGTVCQPPNVPRM